MDMNPSMQNYRVAIDVEARKRRRFAEAEAQHRKQLKQRADELTSYEKRLKFIRDEAEAIETLIDEEAPPPESDLRAAGERIGLLFHLRFVFYGRLAIDQLGARGGHVQFSAFGAACLRRGFCASADCGRAFLCNQVFWRRRRWAPKVSQAVFSHTSPGDID
jgi:hypothetical protein